MIDFVTYTKKVEKIRLMPSLNSPVSNTNNHNQKDRIFHRILEYFRKKALYFRFIVTYRYARLQANYMEL